MENGSINILKFVMSSVFIFKPPYSLDQTPLSISRRTSRSAERNSRRSRIVAAPRLYYSRSMQHVDMPRDSRTYSFLMAGTR